MVHTEIYKGQPFLRTIICHFCYRLYQEGELEGARLRSLQCWQAFPQREEPLRRDRPWLGDAGADLAGAC
jgi:hypothetical protein